jgi:hypothetical protein
MTASVYKLRTLTHDLNYIILINHKSATINIKIKKKGTCIVGK